jgi:hypothetical protein
MQAIAAFDHTWLTGLVFFGIHLLALGTLILEAASVPRFIGYLLILAGAGYLADSFAHFMLPDYAAYQDLFTAIVVLPGVVGELSLTVWLLVRSSPAGALVRRSQVGRGPE